MSDSKCSELRNLLSEIQVVIIDEISMVLNITFRHIHQRLFEIFGCNYEKFFAGKSILDVGDLLQLPQVKSCFVFTPINGPLRDMFSLWEMFQMCELTEVMCQKGDHKFIEIINNIRIGKAIDVNLDLLAKCKTNIDKVKTDATLLYAENAPKDSYNLTNLIKIPNPLLEIKAIDKFSADIPPDIIKSFKEWGQSKTSGFPLNLRIKKDAWIILTSNLDIADCFINGQLGTVFDFQYSEGTKI